MQESIRRNTVFALLVSMSGAIFTGILTIYLVRALGPDEYGVFVLAVAITGMLVLAADFGVSHSAARFIAERRGNPADAGSVVADSVVLKLAIGGIVGVGLVAAAGPIASAYDAPDLAWPLRILAIAVLGQSLLQLWTGSFTAIGRNSISFRLVLSESVVETTTSIALVVLGTGVVGAAGGRAIGFGFGGLLGLILIARTIGAHNVKLRPHPGPRMKRILTYAGALLIVDAAYSVYHQIDVLLIGAILGAGAAGVYAAPVKILSFIQYPGLALAGGVAPRLASEEGGEPNVGAFTIAVRYLIVLQMALVAPLVVWAGPITDLMLGDGYEESADVLRGLAPYIFLGGIGPLISLGVNYLGEAKRRIPIAFAAVAANAAIDLTLIPEIGIVAGAIGTDVAMAIYVAGHLMICRRTVGMEIKPLVVASGKALTGAAVMAAILLAFGAAGLGVASYLVGGLLAAAAYAGVILALRTLSPRELALARNLFLSRLPALRGGDWDRQGAPESSRSEDPPPPKD